MIDAIFVCFDNDVTVDLLSLEAYEKWSEHQSRIYLKSGAQFTVPHTPAQIDAKIEEATRTYHGLT